LNGKRILLVSLAVVLVLSSALNAECRSTDTFDKFHELDVGGMNPPTIEWMYSDEASVEVGVHWDGVYTGQTEEVWASTNWVNDSDGVDTVIYQYKWWDETQWMNRTPTIIQSNATHGQFHYTFIQSVWWNWEENRPIIEGGGGFRFRIFANDSLGNWRTTIATFYTGGYMAVNPPPEFYLFPSVIGAIVLTAIIGALAVYVRRRG
jgi:hypothetical protein